MPWVQALRARGQAVFVVYEACGFGFGLYRALQAIGATCFVIAPRKLDEQRTGVKTDARDAATLCQRLSRYVEGNTKELAVIRVPSEEEETSPPYPSAAHSASCCALRALVRHRTKLQAHGRGLLVCHGQPAPPHWWRAQTWARPGEDPPPVAAGPTRDPAFHPRRARYPDRHPQHRAGSRRPRRSPPRLGKLTTVTLEREVCSWHRFKNRRQVSSYSGLCPGEHSSGQKRGQGSVSKHGNPRLRACLVELAWRLVRFQPGYPPCKNG